jgi:TonB family protein
VERVREAARQFDNHLVAAAIPVENSGDVFLLLFAPGPDEGVPFGGEVAVHSLNASAGAHVGSARRIRLGENVLAAKLLEHPEPEYPALARQARLQGRVVMRAIIGEDGRVENLQLLSGHPMLVASAMEAVRQWVYQPTLLNGKPVEVEGEVHVDFTLPSSTP